MQHITALMQMRRPSKVIWRNNARMLNWPNLNGQPFNLQWFQRLSQKKNLQMKSFSAPTQLANCRLTTQVGSLSRPNDAYHADSNLIIHQAFKSKKDTHCITSHNAIMTRLATQGLSVDLQILDNQASAAYKHAITFK